MKEKEIELLKISPQSYGEARSSKKDPRRERGRVRGV